MLKFWKGKTVFITGHTGFKGSWLSLWLAHLGARVIGFALAPPTTPNLFTMAQVADHITSLLGDIRDFTLLQTTLKQYQPDLIIHMAAQPLVRYSYDHPIETYSVNVLGTTHLLEAARHTHNVRAILNVTTDKCYENKGKRLGYEEQDTLGGHDPYSNSKACSELVTQAYRDSYFHAKQVGLASARAGNVIGGGDWAEDRLIPDILRAALDQRPVHIRYPHAIRPWQHVLDPLQGYLNLLQHLYESPDRYAQSFNFGPPETDARPVSFIADYVTQQFNTTWETDAEPALHEAHYLTLNCTKAKTLLHWQPCFSLMQGLEETVLWYRAYLAKANLHDITLDQIKRFMMISTTEKSDNDTRALHSCSLR